MYANEDIYEGEFVAGEMNGYGKLIQKDGTQYESFWVNNKPNGRGKMTSMDGSFY